MKNELKTILTIVKNIMKGLVNIIGHLFKLVYLIIKGFDNLIVKIFNKLPRFIKVIIIYLLIASMVFTIMVLTKNINISFM